jgi:hypothetical protein
MAPAVLTADPGVVHFPAPQDRPAWTTIVVTNPSASDAYTAKVTCSCPRRFYVSPHTFTVGPQQTERLSAYLYAPAYPEEGGDPEGGGGAATVSIVHRISPPRRSKRDQRKARRRARRRQQQGEPAAAAPDVTVCNLELPIDASADLPAGVAVAPLRVMRESWDSEPPPPLPPGVAPHPVEGYDTLPLAGLGLSWALVVLIALGALLGGFALLLFLPEYFVFGLSLALGGVGGLCQAPLTAPLEDICVAYFSSASSARPDERIVWVDRPAKRWGARFFSPGLLDTYPPTVPARARDVCEVTLDYHSVTNETRVELRVAAAEASSPALGADTCFIAPAPKSWPVYQGNAPSREQAEAIAACWRRYLGLTGVDVLAGDPAAERCFTHADRANAAPVLAVEPQALRFPGQRHGGGGMMHQATVDITNTADALYDVRVGKHANVHVDPPAFTLRPRESTTVTVRRPRDSSATATSCTFHASRALHTPLPDAGFPVVPRLGARFPVVLRLGAGEPSEDALEPEAASGDDSALVAPAVLPPGVKENGRFHTVNVVASGDLCFVLLCSLLVALTGLGAVAGLGYAHIGGFTLVAAICSTIAGVIALLAVGYSVFHLPLDARYTLHITRNDDVGPDCDGGRRVFVAPAPCSRMVPWEPFLVSDVRDVVSEFNVFTGDARVLLLLATTTGSGGVWGAAHRNHGGGPLLVYRGRHGSEDEVVPIAQLWRDFLT